MNAEVALKEIKRVAHQVLPPGGKVFLFGSRARNEGHSDSDWDILILLEKEKIQDVKKIKHRNLKNSQLN